MGTMMYSFYQHQETLPKGFNTSSIVPYFILTEMPPFIGGLLIAAIFAAAQSTISSSLNSISACTSEDIKHRFGKRDDKSEVKFARLIIVIAGLLSYGISMYLIAADSNNLWIYSYLLLDYWCAVSWNICSWDIHKTCKYIWCHCRTICRSNYRLFTSWNRWRKLTILRINYFIFSCFYFRLYRKLACTI